MTYINQNENSSLQFSTIYLDTVNELKATFKIIHILMQIFPET